MSKLSILAAAGAALLLSTASSAQSFNIDLGDPGNGTPAPTYGAAALLPGVWNMADANSANPVALVDLNGSPTTAQLTQPAGGNITFDQACTAGDDALLLDDCVDPTTGASFVFSGLQNGNYMVYTYGIAPDSGTALTDVTVVGAVEGTQAVGGDFCSTNAHALGLTYALHTVDVTNGTITVNVAVNTTWDSINGFQITPSGGIGNGFCFGDGTGAPCPCGNPGGPSEGCANSTGFGGQLTTSGVANVTNDTIVFTAGGLVPNQPGLLFQGLNQINGGQGNPFGDGLRCAGGGVVRLEVLGADAFGVATSTVQVSTSGGVSPGDTRRYQYWYRDPVNSPCGSAFNLTNGIELIWN